jgi:quinolinate synthase
MSAEESPFDKKEILERIGHAKNRLGKDLIILAHFYQKNDIVRFADFVGDSLQLAEQASKRRDAPYIVFCAVSFMAEMARILCSPEQEVLHPEPLARCPLADMTWVEQAEAAWTELKPLDKRIIPVVYVNSNANLKAFCGRNKGMVCTSSNAKQVFNYVFSKGASVFFFPDENLGRNTSHALGITDHKTFLWDPEIGRKGTSEDVIKKVKVFLWKGYCYVHTEFLSSDIKGKRKKYDGIKLIVHPECSPAVVELSDFAGSTSFIKNTVAKSEPGSKWAIGTELNFVNRIKRQNPDKFIIPLKKSACSGMGKVTPQKLLYVLEGLIEGNLYGRVTVEDAIVEDARSALKRMLEIV